MEIGTQVRLKAGEDHRLQTGDCGLWTEDCYRCQFISLLSLGMVRL